MGSKSKMSNISRLLCTVVPAVLAIQFTPPDSAIAQTRTKRPSDFGIELLGKAAFYSFSYQRMVHPAVGIQAGLSGIYVLGSTVVFVSASGKYYLLPKNSSPFATGGVVLLSNVTEAGPLEGGTYAFAGLGFEFRAGGGFLLRGTAYGLFIDDGIFFWPGLDVGYAF